MQDFDLDMKSSETSILLFEVLNTSSKLVVIFLNPDFSKDDNLNKLINIKGKYILNYLLGRDKFIFNFIEELKKYDTINNKQPDYQKFINILQIE